MGCVCNVWDKSELTAAIQDFALGQAVADENPMKEFWRVSPQWAMAPKDEEALSGRKKHSQKTKTR